MRKLNISKIEKGFDWLQKEFDADVMQSVDDLISKLNVINSTLAWAYEQMALAKRELNETKEKAYLTLAASSEANKAYYAPSLAKDYINTRCSKENYAFDLVERFCRALVHIGDNLRTSISAMKEMAKMESYTGSVM